MQSNAIAYMPLAMHTPILIGGATNIHKCTDIISVYDIFDLHPIVDSSQLGQTESERTFYLYIETKPMDTCVIENFLYSPKLKVAVVIGVSSIEMYCNMNTCSYPAKLSFSVTSVEMTEGGNTIMY